MAAALAVFVVELAVVGTVKITYYASYGVYWLAKRAIYGPATDPVTELKQRIERLECHHQERKAP